MFIVNTLKIDFWAIWKQ